MKTRLGRLENQVLAYVQMKKIRQVRILDLISPLGLKKEQLREIFKRCLAETDRQSQQRGISFSVTTSIVRGMVSG